ncbi:hypothetical protein RB195_006964 [Necator americanus]|uniref:Peptidase, S8/S53 family n=1 Tax=Necator americanus TaxID=51031 RepID=A0ABR1BV08_NECAM
MRFVVDIHASCPEKRHKKSPDPPTFRTRQLATCHLCSSSSVLQSGYSFFPLLFLKMSKNVSRNRFVKAVLLRGFEPNGQWNGTGYGKDLPLPKTMNKVEYNCNLEKKAFALLDQSCSTKAPTGPDGTTALFFHIDVDFDGPELFSAVWDWAKQINKFAVSDVAITNKQVVYKDQDRNLYEYLNLMRAVTSKIGCADITCKDGDLRKYRAVCLLNRNPLTNGAVVYKAGSGGCNKGETCQSGGDNDRTSDGGDRFAIEVDETDWHKVRDLAESAGFVIEKKLQSFQNVYIARRRSRQKRNVEQIINELITSKSVQWGEPLIPLYRGKRGIFIDPLYEDQLRSWSSTPSMSIPEAWAGGFTGRGVTVAVLDDGVDSQHEELRSSISPELSYNFVEMGADINPKPGKDETHGTRCAGVIVMAANNSKCGVGVAHNARLAVLKVLGEGQYVNDAIEGDSLAFRSDSIDIYSASWGPKDDGRSMERPGLLAQRALQYGTMHVGSAVARLSLK